VTDKKAQTSNINFHPSAIKVTLERSSTILLPTSQILSQVGEAAIVDLVT
jgi:hypothetical protein